ncbi:MAG: hypothetical protein WKF84_02445 [Pyrinomonadaceae bacterium]
MCASRGRFTVEARGRYRVSADLSLGGGVLGQMKLGSARAALVATNSQVQLNNFSAEVLSGSARRQCHHRHSEQWNFRA